MRKHQAHLSDEALVALVARGDESALGELYDRIGRIAYGLAVRVLRDDRLAEDAVQEAFLAVWRSAAGFRAERAKASTWILTLVHRRAVDLVRREERRRTEPLDEEAARLQGRLVVGQDGRGVLVLDGLDPAPAGKTYELWIVEDEQTVPAGLFAGHEGVDVVGVNGTVAPGDVVAVTIEDDGGVEVSANDPIVASGPV